MAEKLDKQEVLSFEEALRMEIFINQALIELLVEKGIFSHRELTEKVKVISTKRKMFVGQPMRPKK